MSQVSFFQEKPVACPICTNAFRREVLRTGRGRIIAGDLQPDLRRAYKPSPKFGLTNPLIFNAVVCPTCLYAALPEDFLMVPDPSKAVLAKHKDRRKKWATSLFGPLDFNAERDDRLGAASFLLALMTYSSFPSDFAPTTKKAICALRASWLVRDLWQAENDSGYDRIYVYLRHSAWKLYEKAMAFAQNGKETFDNLKSLGPDIDMNYGYDGALYMLAFLGLEQTEFLPEEERYEKLKGYRIALSKIFGFGKVSKNKPGPLMATAKELHNRLGAAIAPLDAKYGTRSGLKL